MEERHDIPKDNDMKRILITAPMVVLLLIVGLLVHGFISERQRQWQLEQARQIEQKKMEEARLVPKLTEMTVDVGVGKGETYSSDGEAYRLIIFIDFVIPSPDVDRAESPLELVEATKAEIKKRVVPKMLRIAKEHVRSVGNNPRLLLSLIQDDLDAYNYSGDASFSWGDRNLCVITTMEVKIKKGDR